MTISRENVWSLRERCKFPRIGFVANSRAYFMHMCAGEKCLQVATILVFFVRTKMF